MINRNRLLFTLLTVFVLIMGLTVISAADTNQMTIASHVSGHESTPTSGTPLQSDITNHVSKTGTDTQTSEQNASDFTTGIMKIIINPI